MANICFCQYWTAVATGIPSTAWEKAFRTGEVPDWSTGTAVAPLPHRPAVRRKTAARSARRTLAPATEGWTITTKSSAPGDGAGNASRTAIARPPVKRMEQIPLRGSYRARLDSGSFAPVRRTGECLYHSSAPAASVVRSPGGNPVTRSRNALIVSVAAALTLLAGGARPAPAQGFDPAVLRGADAPPNALWLEQLDFSAMTSGWGTPLAGKTVQENPLLLGRVLYPRGIGTHSASEWSDSPSTARPCASSPTSGSSTRWPAARAPPPPSGTS